MPQTWIDTLKQYNYSVSLADYKHANNFERFFKQQIQGDRNSTIDFENYFRSNTQEIGAWCEVVFWKLYSQKRSRDENTKKCWDFWTMKKLLGKNSIKQQRILSTIWIEVVLTNTENCGRFIAQEP